MSAQPTNELNVERVINIPSSLVFDAWVKPEHLVHWWGPDGFTVTITEMDVRPGGEWQSVMHGPDGTDYKNRSVFIETNRPNRLIYSHVTGPRFLMTVSFEALDDQTRLTMQMKFDTVAEYDNAVKTFGIVDGARQTIDRLEHYLKKVNSKQ